MFWSSSNWISSSAPDTNSVRSSVVVISTSSEG